MAEPPPFPNIEDGDSDDVSWALETGKSMWLQGEHQDALRWLKRASETASEEGDDMRSLSLAMAAADLRSYCAAAEAQQAAAAAPPTTMALEDEGGAAQRPSAHLLEAVAEAKALARQKQQAAAGVAPPAPASWPQAGGAEVPEQHRIPIGKDEDEGPTLITTKQQRQQTRDLIRQLESGGAPAGPPPLPQRAQGVAPAPAHQPAAAQPAPSQPAPSQPAPSQPAAAQPAPAPSAPAPSAPSQPAAAPWAAAQPAPSQPAPSQPAAAQPAPAQPAVAEVARHDAVRVAVQPVEGRPGVYIARPLKPGEKPGPGARAALLVALKPSTPVLF